MSLNIGRVAALFGISPETLRYYEQEGFLSPQKNRENNYREYDFTDLFLLTDLLFYRDIGIPIKDIHSIFDGIGAEEITGLIGDKKLELQKKIKHLENSLTKLENWEQLHSESLEYMNKYDIRPMPIALRPLRSYEDSTKALEMFQKSVGSGQDLAFFLTFSFFCNFKEKPPLLLRRYIALDKSVARNLPFSFDVTNMTEESFPRCLFTVAKYQRDGSAMLAPLLAYAKEHKLELTGEVYGRQSINTYSNEAYQEYYRIYAVLQ